MVNCSRKRCAEQCRRPVIVIINQAAQRRPPFPTGGGGSGTVVVRGNFVSASSPFSFINGEIVSMVTANDAFLSPTTGNLTLFGTLPVILANPLFVDPVSFTAELRVKTGLFGTPIVLATQQITNLGATPQEITFTFDRDDIPVIGNNQTGGLNFDIRLTPTNIELSTITIAVNPVAPVNSVIVVFP